MQAADITPMVTYGTHPGMAIPIGANVPAATDEAEEKALAYMGITNQQTHLNKYTR
jgi:3-isopropylmalate/(R)-2-methylmalate dehydratase large subunit